MKTIVEKVPRVRIGAFAKQHDLTMRVIEREPGDPILRPGERFEDVRFYACFDGCEVKDGSVLIGTFGNGPNERAAIAAYAKEISNKRLVIDSYSPKRREIEAPYLY